MPPHSPSARLIMRPNCPETFFCFFFVLFVSERARWLRSSGRAEYYFIRTAHRSHEASSANAGGWSSQ
eukprot:2309333-Pyramimonas_sp.AAC.1